MGLIVRSARVLLGQRGVRIALGAAAVGLVGFGVVWHARTPSRLSSSGANEDCIALPTDGGELPARAILGRIWFDRYPEKPTDSINLAFFLAGGIGFYDSGSAYRSCSDIVEFERQNDKLQMKFLQDGKQAEMRFKVTKCDDVAPFNVCLTIDNPPRGPKRYFGFA
jgi:hypothetical protein